MGFDEIADAVESTTKTTIFRDELRQLINRHSRENGSGTPDFILAEFLKSSLQAFDKAVNRRENWYGRKQDPRFGTPAKGILGDE